MQEILNVADSIRVNIIYVSESMFPIAIFAVLLLYLFCSKRKQPANYLYLCIFSFLILLSPFAANNIVRFFLGGAISYGEVFFALPIIAVTAYAVVQFFEYEMKKKKAVFVLLLFVFLQLGVMFRYDFSALQKKPGLTKVDAEVEELGQIFSTYNAKCIAPEEVASRIGEIGVYANVLYGKFAYDESDVKEMVKVAQQYDCNTIVINKEDDNANYLNKKKFWRSAETEHYFVYVYLGD